MSMTETITEAKELAREHAKAGFEYLRERDVELNYADPDSLDMISYCGCILSQRSGDYWLGIKDLGLADEQTFELGFGGGMTQMDAGTMSDPHKSAYFDELQKAWLHLLDGE